MSKNKQKSLVWAFYKPGQDAKNYLIGTMHVRDEQAFYYESLFRRVILATDIFATELDLDAAASADVQSVMRLEPPLSLSNVLSEKLYAKTAKCLKKHLQMDIAYFEDVKPLFITNILSEAVLSQDRVLTLDAVLWSFAKEQGRILRGVESLELQLGVLRAMTLAEQVKALKDVVSHFTRFRRRLLHMAHLYEKGDLRGLHKAAKRSAKGHRRLLIYDRNKTMAEAVMGLAAEGTTCVAVGAGHLAGKKGILRLLEQAGFVVEPVFK